MLGYFPVQDTTQIYRPILIRIIGKRLPDAKIYLFGSRARGSHGEGSDIDLGLDDEKSIEAGILLDLYSDINDSTIPVGVDLVDINTASHELKNEILREGILWKN